MRFYLPHALILLTLNASAASATPTFTDISSGSGLNSNTLHSMCFADFNNDGYIDMAKANTATSGVRTICINDGDSTFTCSTTAIGNGYRGIGWGDYNDDGYVDLSSRDSSNSNSPEYIRNDGASDGLSWTVFNMGSGNNNEAVMFADIDGDGDLDLWNMGDTHVWHANDGNDTFTADNNMPGLADDDRPNGEGCTQADFDNDGYLDFMWNDSDASSTQAWTNDGDFTYTNHENVNTDFGLPEAVGAHENMEWAWGDYDNDADLDVFISGPNGVGLYRNNGSGVFTDVSTSASVTISATTDGADWGDMDNDGDLDLIVAKGASSILYENDGDGTFTDVTSTAGISTLGNVIGWLDVDLDGDLDLMDGEGTLWRNNEDDSDYLRVIARGGAGKGGSPRTAIGAQITVFEAGTSTVVGYREISGGYNNFQQPWIQHFGVTPTSEYDVQVLFPSSQRTLTRYNVQPNEVTHTIGSTTLNNTIEIVESDVNDSLVGYWKFNEGSGSEVNDSTGKAANGTITGASWDTGLFGNNLDFNGSSDRIDVTHHGELSITDELTLAMFAYKDSVSGYDLGINKGTSGTNQNYWLGTNGDELTFGFHNGAFREFTSTAENLATDTWYHLAATYDNTYDRVVLYINGNEVLSTTTSQSMSSNSDSLYIGRSQYGEYWDGKLDEVRIYNRVLNAQEIANLARNYGLVGHWKLDDLSGGSTPDAIAGNDGTVTNAVADDGYICDALEFDGTGDYVTISSLLGSPSDITLSAWVDLDSGASDKEIVSVGDYVAVRADDPNVEAFYYDGSSWRVTPSSTTFAGTGWRHVAYTFDDANDTQLLYIDGTQVANSSFTGSISYSGLGPNTLIGRHGNGSTSRDFDGHIDDVRIYNRTLSASEIQALAARYKVIDLGTISEDVSIVYDLNDSEEVVGADQSLAGARDAFTSKYCKFTTLGTLTGGTKAEAFGVNASGTCTGWSDMTGGSTRAFSWTSGGGMSDLGVLAGNTDSLGNAINSSGEIAGTSFDLGPPSTNREAFIYLPVAAYSLSMGMNGLGTLGGNQSVARDINDSGQVVGGAQNSTGKMQPFIWLPSAAYSLSAGINDLGSLGGETRNILNRAEAINASGETVGRSYTASDEERAFIWLPSAAYTLSSGINNLGILTGGTRSWAIDINDSGQVVGVSDVTGGIDHAFIWENGTMSDLNDLIDPASGWVLNRATAINADGEIVGFGTNKNGRTHAFMLVQTCSSTSTQTQITASLQETIDESGESEVEIFADSQSPVAAVHLTGAPPGATLDFFVTEAAANSIAGPGPQPGTRQGFDATIAASRTLDVRVNGVDEGFALVVEIRLTENEFEELRTSPSRLQIHSLDVEETLAKWKPVGRSLGNSEPTNNVGDAGFQWFGKSLSFWAVTDREGMFAVGAAQSSADSNAPQPTPPSNLHPCGFGWIPTIGVLLTMQAFRYTSRRDRKRD